MSAADGAQPLTDAEADALFADLSNEPALVLAVSGGPDSTALLLLAARWRQRLQQGPKLLAVTVDHGLRPESRAEAAQVERFAATLGVSHLTLRWEGPKPATGLQKKAREVRYRLLAQAAKEIGARCILTAHTLDDQAETVLLRLARGSGIAGLAAMARVTPMNDLKLVRPLLHVPKARLLATVQAAGAPYSEDPSNRDPRFARVRIRALLPALAREGIDAQKLALFARRMAWANEALEAAVDEAAEKLAPGPWPPTGPVVMAAERFARLPREIALRLLGRAIGRVGDEGPVELGKLETLFGALLNALAGSAPFRRTLAGAVVTLRGNRLSIERAPPRRRRAAAPDAEGARPQDAGMSPFTKER